MKEDLAYTRYPQAVAGEESHPPFGGIGVGVTAYSEAYEWHCRRPGASPARRTRASTPSSRAICPPALPATTTRSLPKIYPEDLLQLFQDGLDAATPRTATPYWSDVSGAIQSTWHSPGSVNQDTPEKSATFIDEILHGEKLL